MKKNKFFVYLLKCSDGTFYCGYTNDIENRLKVHNGEAGQGVGAKYTRGRRPVTLHYCEEVADKSSAMKREYELKQLTRDQKENLVGADL
tara:strand:+ start:1102 stop:1371 length:270 start_codon:yes stop_codon:yes gene_type:complete